MTVLAFILIIKHRRWNKAAEFALDQFGQFQRRAIFQPRPTIWTPTIAVAQQLFRQHPPHDAVAVNEEVDQRRRHMDADHHQQRPLHHLMPAVDRLPGGRIFGS